MCLGWTRCTHTALKADHSAHRALGPSREEVLYLESELDFLSDGMTHMVGTHSIAEESQRVGRSVHPVGAAERLTVILVSQIATFGVSRVLNSSWSSDVVEVATCRPTSHLWKVATQQWTTPEWEMVHQRTLGMRKQRRSFVPSYRCKRRQTNGPTNSQKDRPTLITILRTPLRGGRGEVTDQLMAKTLVMNTCR